MKFCKSLQKVVEISDPAYSAFFVNYRMLKKIIKELPSFVPSEVTTTKSGHDKPAAKETENNHQSSETGISESATTTTAILDLPQQHHGETTEDPKVAEVGPQQGSSEPVEVARAQLGRSPGEVAFFKLLHTEFKKATYFFEKAQTEFEIREERVREGMEIMKQPNSIMVNEKWSMLAKSIFKLYKDLLLLETYAIMAYCSFSKILKKHDKVTGHRTRAPFMTNIVNKANFTHYPKLEGMISRCERLYAEVSQRLQEEGKGGLYEDERLFINMISRLNGQVIEGPDGEGAGGSQRKETARMVPPVAVAKAGQTNRQESAAVSKLRSLVEEQEERMNQAEVSEGHVNDAQDRKRTAADSTLDSKRPRVGV